MPEAYIQAGQPVPKRVFRRSAPIKCKHPEYDDQALIAERKGIMGHLLKMEMCGVFRSRLEEDEKSAATVKKYIHDVKLFFNYVG